MVHFQPDPIGIFEDDVVVTRCPVSFNRSSVDECVHLAEFFGNRLHVLARAGPKAKMMHANPIGIEALPDMLVRAALEAKRRAGPDMVDEVVPVIDLLQPKKRQQLTVEGARLLELAHR
jgi:hypothetical protein